MRAPLLAIATAALGLAGCWDWSFPPELLRADSTRPGDARRDQPIDRGSDVPAGDRMLTEVGVPDGAKPDMSLDGPKPDTNKLDAKLPDGPGVDAKKSDLPKPDLPKPDLPKPDLPKPDLPKPDVPKPDLPKPDLPKPDLPKPDLPKPDTLLPCGVNCTGAGKQCQNGVCVVSCPGPSCSCPPNEPRCKLLCSGSGDCTNSVQCVATVSCEVECQNGACTGEVSCSGSSCIIECSGSSTCTNAIRCAPNEPCAVSCSSGACTNDIWCDNACPCFVSCPTCQFDKIHCTKPLCHTTTGCSVLGPCGTCP